MSSELFTENIKKTSNGYKVVISYESMNEVTLESTTKYAEIDVQEGGLDVKSNVELTSFPTLKGHNISDHIYRLPIDITIKGTFADNGLKAKNWIGNDRLTQIQNEFEQLQANGTKFRIVTMKNDNANDQSNLRFKARDNMILAGISWSQFQHDMSFIFAFKEALSSSIEIRPTVVDSSDPHLPAITDLSAASLIGEVISSNDVIEMTVEVLRGLDLVNDATLARCVAAGAILTKVSLVVGAATVAGIVLSIAAGSSAIPGPGWVVAAACAVVAGICAVFSWIAAAKRAEQIAHYKSLGHVFLTEDNMTEDEKDEVAKNFIMFLSEVKNAVDNALSNISVYRIAKADRQECTLVVNGTYYVQRIEKNDDDLSYRIESLYLGQTQNKSLPKITALESFSDCTDSAAYFYDDQGITGSTYRVYIISRSAYRQEVMNQPSRYDDTTNTMSNDLHIAYQSDKEKYEAEKNALLDFAFVVSPYALTTLTDKISEVVKKVVG